MPQPPLPPKAGVPPNASAALLEISSDLLAVLDAEGCILWVNSAFLRVSGHEDAARFMGWPLAELLNFPDELKSALAGGRGFESVAATWVHASGDPRSGRMSARPLGAGGGSAFSLQDVTAMKAAEAVSLAHQQMRVAVELGDIVVWRHDLALNRIFYNDLAYRILGLEPWPDGMPVEAVRALIHPDDVAPMEASAEHALHVYTPIDLEVRYRHANGSWVYVLTRRMVRRDERGRPIEFIGVALDVTAQVEKLRTASDWAKRLELAISAAGVGVWSRDPDQPRARWNGEMYRITGRSPLLPAPTREEWIREIVHPDDRESLIRTRASISRDTMAIEHHCRIVRPDGEVRWVVNRARRERRDGHSMVFGVTLDVTERVNAEADLRRANERVALAARSVGMGTWEWDVTTGEAQWDEAMFRLRGLQPRIQALSADERLAMTHPDDTDRVKNALYEASINTGTTAYEFRVVWPDGTVRWIASRSTPLPSALGEHSRRIGVNWDVTEARNAELDRAEHELALRESKAKSEFLSRMSHELRTPLNAVLGFAQLLLAGTAGLPEEQRAKIAHIESAGRHLLALIDDVLDLSSLESGQIKLDLEPLPLAEVLRESLPLVEALAREHGVEICTDALEGIVLADRVRIRQVAINLLSNAIKYNHPRGHVNVSTEVGDKQVTLRISNTGRGLSAEQLAHLYEPFNRLGAESEGIAGTGIGLSVVKALVERMQGSVEASSHPGQDATFEVRLPRALTQAASSAAATFLRDTSAVKHRESGTVLYIEDNAVNVLLVEELLRMRPRLALASAVNGQTGVARAAALRPDLILVDIQLPDIDGFEVLRRLQGQPETSNIPCIALSANAMPEDIARAIAAGFIDYWTKPIHFGKFLAALDQRFAQRTETHGRKKGLA